MFFPDCKRTIRFRNNPDDYKQSILHTEEYKFYFKNLDCFKDNFVTFKLINSENTNKHHHAGLFVTRNCKTFKSCNREVCGKINKANLQLDFLGIERFSGDRAEKSCQNEKRKCRDNCRLQATITNSENLCEIWKFISNEIRDLRSNNQRDLIIEAVGRPPSEQSWENLTITLAHTVPYYPKEIDILINEISIETNTKENRKLEFQIYKFTIPQHILTQSKALQCVLRCKDFDERCAFPLSIHCVVIYKEIQVETACKRKCARKDNFDSQIDETTIIAITENESANESLSHENLTVTSFGNETKTTLASESNNESSCEDYIAVSEESGQLQAYFSQFNKTTNICDDYDDEEVFKDILFFDETTCKDEEEEELKIAEEENSVVENFDERLLMLESGSDPTCQYKMTPLESMTEDMDDIFTILQLDKCQENDQDYGNLFNPFSKYLDH